MGRFLPEQKQTCAIRVLLNSFEMQTVVNLMFAFDGLREAEVVMALNQIFQRNFVEVFELFCHCFII